MSVIVPNFRKIYSGLEGRWLLFTSFPQEVFSLLREITVVGLIENQVSIEVPELRSIDNMNHRY